MNGRLIREAVSTTNCTLSAPCWWPRNRLRARLPAQRPFPSIMMATCCGILSGSSCRYIAVSSAESSWSREHGSNAGLVVIARNGDLDHIKGYDASIDRKSVQPSCAGGRATHRTELDRKHGG